MRYLVPSTPIPVPSQSRCRRRSGRQPGADRAVAPCCPDSDRLWRKRTIITSPNLT